MAHDKHKSKTLEKTGYQQSLALFGQEAAKIALKKTFRSESSKLCPASPPEVTKPIASEHGITKPQVTPPVPMPRRPIKQRSAENPPLPTPRTKTSESARTSLILPGNNQVSPSSPFLAASPKKPPPPVAPKRRQVHRLLKQTAHFQSSEDLDSVRRSGSLPSNWRSAGHQQETVDNTVGQLHSVTGGKYIAIY